MFFALELDQFNINNVFTSEKTKNTAMKKIFFKNDLLNKYLIKNILIYQSQN